MLRFIFKMKKAEKSRKRRFALSNFCFRVFTTYTVKTNKFMKNKIFVIITLSFFMSFNLLSAQVKMYANLSYRLIQDVRDGKDVSKMLDSLQNVEPDVLVKELESDLDKMAFWINVYNAHIQIILGENPEKFEDRGTFFKEKQFYIACQHLSFEDVEHGIIRNSKAPLGLGYLPAWFPGKYERKMRTSDADGRVHFALNCGAKSCPPVAAYDYRRMNEQLNLISEQYLDNHSTYKKEENVVYVPRLLQWFSADFGWFKGGKRKFLAKHGAIPEGTKPKMKFNDYDWTLLLDNFTEV